jgi:uncharacterized membrane protein YphA (DoxX/SURF4 family)
MPDHLTDRRSLAALRILLGIILLYTWVDNLGKGFYTPAGMREFILSLALDHPIVPVRALLEGVAAGAALFAPFQMAAELMLGLMLLVGAFTRLAGWGAAFFFLNLLLAYLNPALGEWIWTYVMLIALAVVSAVSSAGRTWGLDGLLLRRFGAPRLPIR